MSTVIETTVVSGFCCGCGVCAGICPTKSLMIQWNKYGEYNPVNNENNCISCGLCVNVCPFADGNDNEDTIGKNIFGSIKSIQHRKETGYYLSTGVGAIADESHRMKSASGGLATWYLSQLLKRQIVDAVLCVGHAEGNRLFDFFVAKTPKDVYLSTGSVYYPVEISGMFQYIKNNPGKYAIIGLPCLLKGIRLAQKYNSILKDRIVMLVGLACSNLKSSHYAEFIAKSSGLDEKLVWCSFRYKSFDLPRNFFRFQCKGETGTLSAINWGGDSLLWKMYLGRCLTLHSCDCCDDMHAECADITFMDAWLPEYNTEPRGTSLYIARTPLASDIINEGVMNRELDISPVSIDKIILAQDSIYWKRDMLKYRLKLMKRRGEHCPTKRVEPGNDKLNMSEREIVRTSILIQRESRIRYVDDKKSFEKWFVNAYIHNRPIYRRIPSVLNLFYLKNKNRTTVKKLIKLFHQIRKW